MLKRDSVHNAKDLTFTDKIDKAEPIRFSSWFKTSATTGFQPTERVTTEYILNWIKAIDGSPGLWSAQAINCIRATEDVQLEIIDGNLPSTLEHADMIAKICVLNESWAAYVTEMVATELVQDGPTREFAGD
jgi:hypothetical protein